MSRTLNILFIAIALPFVNLWGQDLSPIEYFKIDNSKDTVLITYKGSKVGIPAECFDIPTDLLWNKEIEISIEEAFNKGDMILSNLTTETKNDLLVSDGMIRVLAKSGGRLIDLKKDHEINISLPVHDETNPEMEVYTITDTLGNWEKQEKQLNVQNCKLTISRVIWEYRTATKKAYKEWNKITPKEHRPEKLFWGREINIGGPKIEKTYSIPFPIDTIWTCAFQDTSYYKFNMNSLGWYNIDRIKRIRKPVRIKALAPPDFLVYLIIRNQKICLKGRKKDEFRVFRSIEKDASVALVFYKVLDQNNALFYMHTERVVDDLIIEMQNPQKIPIDLFKRKLKSL